MCTEVYRSVPKSTEECRSGIRRIKSSCKAGGLKEPEIVEKGDFVDVCLFRGTAAQKEEAEEHVDFNEHEVFILKYLKTNNNKVTTKEVQHILSLGESQSRKRLKAMVDKGILQRIGSTTNAYYRTKNAD
jgi:ATP-dependent DNA helicase RecG